VSTQVTRSSATVLQSSARIQRSVRMATMSRAFVQQERSSIPQKMIAKSIDVRSEAKPAKQARTLLEIAFVAAPILAGADKFFNVMTD